jgi:hypothetical protein
MGLNLDQSTSIVTEDVKRSVRGPEDLDAVRFSRYRKELLEAFRETGIGDVQPTSVKRDLPRK